jgi:hypothetical protein
MAKQMTPIPNAIARPWEKHGSVGCFRTAPFLSRYFLGGGVRGTVFGVRSGTLGWHGEAELVWILFTLVAISCNGGCKLCRRTHQNMLPH